MQKDSREPKVEKKEIRVIFMGTPSFSIPFLGGLISNGYNIVGVVTEPDKIQGRRGGVVFSPLKQSAIDKGLDIFQPDSDKELYEVCSKLKPDIIIVAAYGRIIKKKVLELPKHGCVNIHPSLLPALRGPSPVQTAILQGLKKTGVTIMKMDEGMDTGPIISCEELNIEKDETSSSLFEKTRNLGSALLVRVLPPYINGDLKAIEQGKKGVSYTKIIKKEDGKINFKKSAKEEERKIRAYDIWPGVYAFLDPSLPRIGKKRLKILSVELEDKPFGKKKPGEVFFTEHNNFCVAFKKDYWIIRRLQLEGKKDMGADEFLNGYKNIIGSILG